MTEKDFKQIFPLGEKNDAYGACLFFNSSLDIVAKMP